MLIAAEWGVGQVLWSMLWFFMFVIWIWMIVAIFSDIFRSEDLSGWGKALWTIFIIFLPYLGAFVYLIARGSKMQGHAMADAARQEAAFRAQVQEAAGSGGTAAEIAKLAELRTQGAISEEEFQQAKAKVLS